jgi:YVTN family beta-propeller protein
MNSYDRVRVERKGMEVEMAYVTKPATVPEEKMEETLLLGEGESAKSRIKAACATTKVKATIAVAMAIVVAVAVTVGVMMVTPEPPQCKVSVVYVASRLDRVAFAIATDKNQVVADMRVGNYPSGIAVTPDGTRAYVTHIYSNTVFVIDTVTNLVLTTISLVNTSGLHAIAISPDGTRAYVAYRQDIAPQSIGMLSIIDTVTNQVMSTILLNISLSYGSCNMVVHPDGTRVYLTGFAAGVVVFNTVKQVVIDIVPVGESTWGSTQGIAITPDGTQIYLTPGDRGDYSHKNVTVVDTTTNQVKTFIPMPCNFSNSVAVSPDGKQAYVASYLPMNFVTVIDTATNLALEYIPLGPPAYDGSPLVVVSVDGTQVYVANYNPSDGNTINHILAIDAATNKVTADITLVRVYSITAITAAWIPC